MYISSFHIDGFGILSNISVDGLPPGISIFFGRNEAGKSTCLEFLRTMLTGYPKTDRLWSSKYSPQSNARPGGFLILNYETPDGALEQIRLTRRPTAKGGLSLQDSSGNLLAEDSYTALFSGISPEVYRQVFGFSLAELENFSNLNAEGVRNALYGASFGPGLVSPAEALKELRRRKDEIFKATATKLPLNAALKELEELRKSIREKESERAGFDQLCLARDRRKEELSAMRAERQQLENQYRVLQRRLSVWDQWDQWRQIKDRLLHFPELPANFPEEALERLSQLRTLRNEKEADLAAQRQKLDALRERRAKLQINGQLVDMLPALRALAERKASYRQALSELTPKREALSRVREELKDTLLRLGPDWDCARIRATDRSLFAREDLGRHEEELHNAQLAYQAAVDTLESVNQEVATCETAFASANEALSQFPEPEAILSGLERDDLRQTMGRLNESRRLEKSRDAAFQNAQEAFERALSQAKIAIDTDNSNMLEEAAKVLKNIASSQEEARKLAAELQSRQSELENITQKKTRLEENAENIRLKAEAVIADTKTNPASQRDNLEMKSRALRSLRSLSTQINASKEKIQDLESRISNTIPPVRVINWTLLVIAVLLVITGGGLFAANYFWGLAEISLSGGPSLTINLWMCYLLLACGVLLLCFGFPGNSAEKKHYQRELAQLQASRESSVLRMVELNDQAKQLFSTAAVDSLDPITLDASELLLEREKEQCIHDERSQREAENLQKELSVIRTQLISLQRESQLKERDIQQCRRKWLALMESLNIKDCPSPESVATVFARVEAANIALGNLQTANQELEALWEDLHLLESSITSMDAIQQILKDAPQPLGLEEAVTQLLDACKEADLAREQRKSALAAAKTVENALDSARRRQQDAVQRLEKTSTILTECRKSWAEAISSFGLGENLDPQIMREALQLMDKALLTEEKLLHLETDAIQDETEKESFERAIQEFLTLLARDSQENSDWLKVLDALLADAEQALELVNEQKRLNSLIAEQEDEYGSREAALEVCISQLKALLKQGAADTEDAFTQSARLVEEKRQLTETLERLESSLRVAADTQEFSEFMHTFQAEERESQESKLASFENELSALSDREQEAATSFGSLVTQIENLSTNNDLSVARQNEAMLLASIDKLAKQWSEFALAEMLLLKAKHKFEKERQPEVIRIASEIFALITNRKWLGIKTSLEDDKLEILQEHGEPVQPYILSRGAQEQAYLALRLAYIRDHALHANPLPLIMDEVLVNFDPDRAARTAHAFADLVRNPPKNKFQQILYFTCQPHMIEILRSAAPDAKLYILENHDISAA